MTVFCYSCREETWEIILSERSFTVGKGKTQLVACSECGLLNQYDYPDEPLRYISIEGKLKL